MERHNHVLGISAYYHDSASALLKQQGAVLAGAQEERFSRKKHESGFPANALYLKEVLTKELAASGKREGLPQLLFAEHHQSHRGVLVAWSLVGARTLRPVYRVWMRFGILMSRITVPVLMSLIFFLERPF